MLKGAFLGSGTSRSTATLPGWKARPDVSIVAAADARLERRDAFLEAFPAGPLVLDRRGSPVGRIARLRRRLHASRAHMP